MSSLLSSMNYKAGEIEEITTKENLCNFAVVLGNCFVCSRQSGYKPNTFETVCLELLAKFDSKKNYFVVTEGLIINYAFMTLFYSLIDWMFIIFFERSTLTMAIDEFEKSLPVTNRDEYWHCRRSFWACVHYIYWNISMETYEKSSKSYTIHQWRYKLIWSAFIEPS